MPQYKIIDELKKLPESEILMILEKTLHFVREKSRQMEKQRFKINKLQLTAAANALYKDYSTDDELTIFTELDSENFHE